MSSTIKYKLTDGSERHFPLSSFYLYRWAQGWFGRARWVLVGSDDGLNGIAVALERDIKSLIALGLGEFSVTYDSSGEITKGPDFLTKLMKKG